MVKKEAQENVAAEFRIFTIVVAVVLLLCLVFFLVSNMEGWITFKKLDADDVEKITINHCVKLDESNTEKFIKLYNSSSKYIGKELDWGTTPGYEIEITFDDGSQISVTEYDGLYIVTYYYDDGQEYFYIENNKLRTFIQELRA